MSRTLRQFVEPPRTCSYLADQAASLEHRLMLDVGPAELDALLERGWRRFGPDYFRPSCAACDACVPTRIVAGEFSPSKSQRRARRHVAGLRAMVGPPVVDEERIALYHAWHAEREGARAWAPSELDAREYALQFAFPHPCAREVAYHDDEAGGRLAAIAICDETPRGWSLVYCFYDPAYRDRSLGTANVVVGVQIAAERGLPYVYLGYAVAACPSLRYKSTFNPREVLVGRPGPREAPRWVRVPPDPK
jgi:arginyl-tRNA--protein-N-Asp/Glu arginylyltransferase